MLPPFLGTYLPRLSNNSDLNSRGRGHSELYRLVDQATPVEPDSATTSTLNDSDSNSQEQGHLELYRLMDRATHVVPELANEGICLPSVTNTTPELCYELHYR